MYKYYPKKRYDITLRFLNKYLKKNARILDLGVVNPFTALMKNNGYDVINNLGEDLDEDISSLQKYDYEVVTAFEIVEHLVSPFPLLKNINCKSLVVSVPLRLWFAPAYRSKTDVRDRHYHEFEDWQLDWLLEKAGWKIIDRKKWTNPSNTFGIRPFLRRFTYRYYMVYAERI